MSQRPRVWVVVRGHRSIIAQPDRWSTGFAGSVRGVHAIIVKEPGGPEVMQWTEVPDPQPGPNEVLLDVAATAVNRADLLQRQGHYPPPPGASEILGLECSGR